MKTHPSSMAISKTRSRKNQKAKIQSSSMAIYKTEKPQDDPQNIDLLKSDVASFASTLGLSSSLPSSGFNDSDFRKTGPLKQTNPEAHYKRTEKSKPSYREQQLKPKPPPLSIDNNSRGFDKFKNLPKLPLVKASSLGVWYVDAAELEEKVIGKKKVVEFQNVEEWKSLVAKKKDLGERLLAQYALDFETSRGQSGDIKMLTATQRSGTAADKVSAFSVMVGENPVANIRSLDALIGILFIN